MKIEIKAYEEQHLPDRMRRSKNVGAVGNIEVF